MYYGTWYYLYLDPNTPLTGMALMASINKMDLISSLLGMSVPQSISGVLLWIGQTIGYSNRLSEYFEEIYKLESDTEDKQVGMVMESAAVTMKNTNIRNPRSKSVLLRGK